jgi:hypothetical protein
MRRRRSCWPNTLHWALPIWTCSPPGWNVWLFCRWCFRERSRTTLLPTPSRCLLPLLWGPGQGAVWRRRSPRKRFSTSLSTASGSRWGATLVFRLRSWCFILWFLTSWLTRLAVVFRLLTRRRPWKPMSQSTGFGLIRISRPRARPWTASSSRRVSSFRLSLGYRTGRLSSRERRHSHRARHPIGSSPNQMLCNKGRVGFNSLTIEAWLGGCRHLPFGRILGARHLERASPRRVLMFPGLV